LALKAIHHDGICGFDALVQDPSRWLEFLDGADFPRADRPTFCGKIYDYTSLADRACAELEAQEFPTIPCVVAGLDDAPSRGRFANCLINSTPANYQNWLMEAAFDAAHRPIFGASYVFINSWNDWPKGAYLEPDQKYGDAFLRVTADALLPYSAARSRAVARTNKPVVITSFLPEVFTPKSKTAIIIHAFYPDVLDDLLKRLQPCNGRDIFISVVEENAEHLLAVIARHVKDACVYVVPNCGRDARPFLHMLKVVNQFGYESFVKLHTKKSSHTTVGSEWYAALVPPLVELCRPNRLSQILQAHPNVSLIGTAGLILDGSTYMGSSGNIAWLQRLCHELDIRSVPSAFAFVAGTMFGARLAPFQRLIENDFVGMMFEEELGQRDGTLAHALERLFGLLIAWRSETIASVAMVEDELVVDAADQSFVAALMFQKRSKDWKFHVKRLSP
jgi:lipopolysaccharide biosynthesis protein